MTVDPRRDAIQQTLYGVLRQEVPLCRTDAMALITEAAMKLYRSPAMTQFDAYQTILQIADLWPSTAFEPDDARSLTASIIRKAWSTT